MFTLDDVVITAELARRPSRPPDYEAENRALVGLMEFMASRLQADDVLQQLSDMAMKLCRGQSAGVSLLERDEEGREIFRWGGASGRCAGLRGKCRPRFTPCGTVIDRNAVQLMSYPERYYPSVGTLGFPVAEALLVPFHFHGDTVGTVWLLSHDEGRCFDNEDRRMLGSLSRAAASAYQLLMQERLATDLASTERLQEISAELLGENQAGLLYQKIVDAAALIMRSDFASIQVYSPGRGDGGELKLLAHRGFTPEAAHHWGWVSRASATSYGASLRIQARVIVPDVEAHDVAIRHDDLAVIRRTGIRAMQTTPLVSRDGQLLGMLSTHWGRVYSPTERDLRLFDVLARQAADLIERSLSVEHSQLLLNEISHRAKNMLAVVQAMVRQTARKTDPDSFVRNFTDRLAGLAASQDLLVRNDWHGVAVADLIPSQLSHLGDLIGTRVTFSGPALNLVPAAAQTIGMALHELATNAVKYGALSDKDGTVEIEWGLSGRSAESQFLLSWREQGGPPVVPPTRKGFGYSVVVRSLEHALDAEVDLDFAESGLVWSIAAPASAVMDQSRWTGDRALAEVF